jgi:hypothetical protein
VKNNNGNNGNIAYEFRVFLPRGEAYAIRLAGPEVTGVYGPLDYSEVRFSALPRFQYEERPEAVTWIKANISDFVLCEAECDESAIWV